MTKCDVLVVGLGPTGDVLASLLRQRGVSVIAIDREGDVYPLPRAAVFDEEVMRIFQMVGVAEEIRPSCRVPDGYQFLSASHEILVKFELPPGLGRYGWDATYALHQPAVERILRTQAAHLGADLRVNTQLLEYSQSESGVVANVEGPQGQYQIEAQYIVGCDGSRSAVRESFGVPMFDYDFEEPWLVLDAFVENGDDLIQIPSQICDPDQPITFMRMSGNRFRWEFMLKPGDDPETFAEEENLFRLLEPWDVLHRIEFERRAIYRFRGLLASQWRSGRALIAGDAAHQMPPFAGQGMCSGVRDAANLAWKLAAVVQGEASPDLLDTYQTEREAHVRGIVERSIEFGKTVCLLDHQAAAQRDAGMLAARAAGEQPELIPYPPLKDGCLMGGVQSGELFVQPVFDGRRMDDEIGQGPWLFTRQASGRASSAVQEFVVGEDRLGPFSAGISQWLSQHDADAVLVRPDRHVFGVGKPDLLLDSWQDKLTDAMRKVEEIAGG